MSESGDVNVRSLVEGEVKLMGRRVYAQKVLASTLAVTADASATFGAIYA